MRRNDREIKDVLQIEQFISKEQIMRVAFYDKRIKQNQSVRWL